MFLDLKKWLLLSLTPLGYKCCVQSETSVYHWDVEF